MRIIEDYTVIAQIRNLWYTISALHVLKTLLDFATKKSHFVFDGHYYDQIDGVAIGSPLGPVLANIFMCDFEQKWLTNADFRSSIWFRYVDDTFSLFNREATAASFLRFL